MITRLEKLIKKLRNDKLPSVLTILEESLFRTTPKYEGFFAEENRITIQQDSKRVDGTDISRDGFPKSHVYTPQYKAYKSSLGKQTDYIDLTLKGDYTQSIEYKTVGNELVASSTDFKADILQSQYGGKSKLIGLSEQTKKAFLSDAKREIFKLLKNRLK